MESAAGRISSFLIAMDMETAGLHPWYPTADSRRAARESAVPSLSVATIAENLMRNQRDSDGQAINSLGWGITLWDGRDNLFSATLGIYAPGVTNSAILDFGPGRKGPEVAEQEVLLRAMIDAFDPDYAVATSNETLDSVDAELPWQAGWLMYERGYELFRNREYGAR